MNQKTTQRRLYVAQALNELLTRRDIDDITIDQVCQLSGVPRATFYRYFYNLNDVSVWLFRYLLSSYFSPEAIEKGWQEALTCLFTQMLQWKALFMKFYNVHTYDSIFAYASRAGVEDFAASAEDRLGRKITEQEMLVISYHGYAQASLCAKWVRDGMIVPPEEMASVMVLFLPPIMLEYIRGGQLMDKSTSMLGDHKKTGCVS